MLLGGKNDERILQACFSPRAANMLHGYDCDGW